MKFEDAIKKSIKAYYENGDDELEHSKLEKDRKYTKKYFEDFDQELETTRNKTSKK